MTIASIEKIFIEDLTAMYGGNEAASIAWLAIGYVCQVNRTKYLEIKHQLLDESTLSEFYRILSELKSGVPLQYVLGETEFYGSIFKVNPTVLIPRPETEELVDWLIREAREHSDLQDVKILDIGTGSGCISVSIKKFLPEAGLSGMDISIDALNMARENAARNQADVTFILDDILNPTGSYGRYSIIVSNPPYVMIQEKSNMHANVLDHEPHNALFVTNDDPLVFYDAIAQFALSHLEYPAILFFEINENLGKETVALLKKKGFSNIELRKDLRDRDRMIRARL